MLLGLIGALPTNSVLAAEVEFHDVFVPKADGFVSIRIPSLVVAADGTLLAFAEGRAANRGPARTIRLS